MSNVLDAIHTAETMEPAGPLDPMPPELATYEDAENPEVRGPWRIETIQSADWALARMAELQAEAEQVDAMRDAAIRRIEEKAEAMKAKIARGVSFFGFKLLEYGQRNKKALLGGGKKKSRAFLHGSIGWRTKNKGGRLAVEDAKALEAWLVLQPVDAGFYRQKIEPEMKALQAQFQADGVIPPGCRVEEEIDEPYVKAEAPERALEE